MTAPKLDEARLREFPTNDPTNPLHRLGDDLAEGRIKDLAVSADVAYALSRIAELEDALSAERERGDRALGLLRRWLPQGGRYDAAIDTRAFLATQKAVGAK